MKLIESLVCIAVISILGSYSFAAAIKIYSNCKYKLCYIRDVHNGQINNAENTCNNVDVPGDYWYWLKLK